MVPRLIEYALSDVWPAAALSSAEHRLGIERRILE